MFDKKILICCNNFSVALYIETFIFISINLNIYNFILYIIIIYSYYYKYHILIRQFKVLTMLLYIMYYKQCFFFLLGI